MKTPAERLRHIRKNVLGITQEAMSELAEVSSKTIFNFENGYGGTQMVVEISRAVGLRAEWLRDGKGERWADGKSDSENRERVKAVIKAGGNKTAELSRELIEALKLENKRQAETIQELTASLNALIKKIG